MCRRQRRGGASCAYMPVHVGGVRAAGVEPAARLWAVAARPEGVRRGKTSLRRWRGLRAGERCTRGRGVRGRGVRGIDTHGYRAGGADVKDTLPALAHMGWVGGSAWEDAEGHTLQVNN